MAIFDPYMVDIFIGCLQQTLCQLDIIGNLMFEANFEVFYSLWVEDILRILKVNHWLPLRTSYCTPVITK